GAAVPPLDQRLDGRPAQQVVADRPGTAWPVRGDAVQKAAVRAPWARAGHHGCHECFATNAISAPERAVRVRQLDRPGCRADSTGGSCRERRLGRSRTVGLARAAGRRRFAVVSGGFSSGKRKYAMAVAALIMWVITALGGIYLLAVWLIE